MMGPKVSVIMPSLNVAGFIRECMDSVTGQTLQNIEIICVDAGSEDGTLEILREYEACDSRIRVIESPIRSYGYQMNLGLDAAKGEYIGIVETDDWAEPKMFALLYSAAQRNKADFVKANYYWHTTSTGKDILCENLRRCPMGKVFPAIDSPELFGVTPAIWSGLYSRELLVKNGIRFNETPGASYQDTSFHLMVCTVAARTLLLREPVLHYRVDNANSSVKSARKAFCVSNELHYYEEFLSQRPRKQEQILEHYIPLKYEKYRWNYDRLSTQLQWDFLTLMRKEFLQYREQGLLQKRYFFKNDWQDLQLLLEDEDAFFDQTRKSGSQKSRGTAGLLRRIPRKIWAAARSLREYGLAYTVKYTVEQVLGQERDKV